MTVWLLVLQTPFLMVNLAHTHYLQEKQPHPLVNFDLSRRGSKPMRRPRSKQSIFATVDCLQNNMLRLIKSEGTVRHTYGKLVTWKQL